jgi:hypothetical protein
MVIYCLHSRLVGELEEALVRCGRMHFKGKLINKGSSLTALGLTLVEDERRLADSDL